MPWYKTGTISVTNGSTAVTGSGTGWIANAAAGEAIKGPDGKYYEIASIGSNTALTLASAYLGATAAGQAYEIMPTQSFIRDLAAQAAELVANYAGIASGAGAGKFGDGTLEAPGVAFAADPDTGIRRTASGTYQWVSNGVDMAEIGPNGFKPAKLILPASATPAETAEGEIVWDSDDDVLTVGTATGRKTVVNTDSVQTLSNKTIIDSAVSANEATLTAIDKTFLTSTTLVDVFLYDTAKDSDGGAWRQRCGHTSWENEALTGNWLGSAASEAAARALTGAVTGSYYYDTTAAGFYSLNAGSGKTQVYRGNAKKFPAQVLITAEAARVVIWDVTQAGCPMWMVFGFGADTMLNASGTPSTQTATVLAAVNGALCVGTVAGAKVVFFAGDCRRNFSTNGYRVFRGAIGSRNSSLNETLESATAAIVNFVVNDVAITVLPNAPVDLATGLPIPTIAVATDGGVSVIKDDGNVWDIVANNASYIFANAVGFTPDGLVWFEQDANNSGREVRVHTIPTADVSFTYNAKGVSLEAYSHSNAITGDLAILVNGVAGNSELVPLAGNGIGTSLGLNLIKRNPTTPANGLIAYVTKEYNSGWQPGSIKGTWLADSTAETITGSELVTNGTFATDTSGWTTSGSTFVMSGGAGLLTNSGAANGFAEQIIATVVGKTYTASATLTLGTATGPGMRAGTSSTAANLAVTSSASSGILSITFTATSTTTYLGVSTNSTTTGHTATFDNITCRLAVDDRSVKAKGAQVFGSLTKAAVATGAQLVGYSGFSAANYIEQPYNSDLDFGTADFCIMGWLKEAPNSITECIYGRGAYSGSYSGAGFALSVNSAGYLVAGFTDDAFATQDQVVSTAVVDDSVWKFVMVARRGSYFELWVNAAKAASDTAVNNANTSLSNTSATFRLGKQQDGAPLSNGTLALWRTSAYAPTAEQIKHIYETEKALFDTNAQCCLGGTSNAITALAYDDEADLLHVGTSYGRSAFKGLRRVALEATPVGAIKALAAGAGIVAQAGASGSDIYVPAYNLREELDRDAEQAAAFGQPLVAHDFDATASQTTFTLPIGWEIVAVYAQGSLKREGASKDWTRASDGYKWSVVFAAGRSASDWISILAKRTTRRAA